MVKKMVKIGSGGMGKKIAGPRENLNWKFLENGEIGAPS